VWSTIREVAETILLTVLIFLLVRSVVQNYKVDGRSMEPTLEGGQLLLVNKAAYWRQRGRDYSQGLLRVSNP